MSDVTTMEEDPINEETDNSLKRSNNSNDSNNCAPNKKVRLSFSVKEFRKQLKTEQKTQALQHFLQSIIDEDQNCVMYLEHGGSPLEILQSMEGEIGVSPSLVFEVVNGILLQIGTKLPQYQNSAYDACRYLLNTYLTQLNKMLGLSSSMKERVATLRLLTTIVTFSTVLAKDILLHVNFNPANLELLTKVGEGKNEARGVFIHFIVAFLVDGHFPTLSVLLEKKGLMTSIIRGLQFDKADIVILALTAMQNHILENTSVSKTIKMKTFSTPVVKDIVNLYNWRGPGGIMDQKKKTKVSSVNQIDKTKVNEAVHSFLLILCTSHKFGVIFKDPLVGLGKRQNSLMLTVLESLERPWEHSYASELVLKICKACPDLVRAVWTNLKTFLEPRWTEKWLKAMKFAKLLINELQPDSVEYALTNLNINQVVQVITILTSPLPILKVLIPENRLFDKPATKHQVVSLFLEMINSLEIFLTHPQVLSNFDNTLLRQALKKHIYNNFPNIDLILTDWDYSDENMRVSDYLNVAFDLLEKYRKLAPQLLEEPDINFDIKEFLSISETVVDESDLRKLQIKAVKLFINLDPGIFKSNTELFKNVISFSFEYYFFSKDPEVLEFLHEIVQNTGAFDGYSLEINIWINGILNLKSYDNNVDNFFCSLVEKANNNATEYNNLLFEYGNTNFSTLVLSLNNFNSTTKSVKNYLNFVLLNIFHAQNETNKFTEIVTKLDFISENLKNYFDQWNKMNFVVLEKMKGKLLDDFHNFSQIFFQDKIEDFNFNLYPDHKLNILQMTIFYLTNLIKADALNQNHKDNCSKLLDFLISEKVFEDDRFIGIILGNALLLENFNLFNSEDFLTKFILKVVKNLNNELCEKHLVDFRKRIVSIILKVFRKPSKYQNNVIFIDILETIKLDYEQCRKLLIKFVDSTDNKNFYSVVTYCLNRMAEIGKNYDSEPLTDDTINKLSDFFKILIEDNVSNLSPVFSSFHEYLKVFSHNIGSVNKDFFMALASLTEYNKDNLSLCEFLLDRKLDCREVFKENLDEICSKRSFILSLLNVVIKHFINDAITLEKIYQKLEGHLIKAIQKPHKAGQHFQNRYHSIGILIEKFMKSDGFGKQIQKFETTELFHVYLLKKVFDKVEKDDKIFGNMVLTYIHLLTSLLKQKSGSKPVENLTEISNIIHNFLHQHKSHQFNLKFLNSNESLKTFSKLCLKHGVTGDFVLLKILADLVELCVEEDEGRLILDMLFSHSQFLDVVLGDSPKIEIIWLWMTLCSKWPQFMERSHVPILLSSYQATKAEKVTLDLLKLYESSYSQTKFYDFKPFLWGRAAASHYSVRSDIRKALWRQPKMADVLNNLHFGTIQSTITNPQDPTSYDLDYFLPLFSHLLSPESPVTTYTFTKSGALALSLTGFRGDQSQRLATCHILQRFYFHLEAKQSGKDNLLWLRFIEAICKGVAVLDDFKINNFVGVFLARMAIIMTQPNDVMYVPLTQYLSAKEELDFNTIPELYTLLHSPHVDFKKHQAFILEVLRDGLKDEKDFTILLKSMGFKLISELCSSVVCDSQTKLLILEVFEKCCQFEMGVKVLCTSLSFLSQLFSLVLQNGTDGTVLIKLLKILSNIIEIETDKHRNFIVYFNLITLLEDEYFHCMCISKCLNEYYKLLMIIVERFPHFLTEEHINKFLIKSKDQFCKYLIQYGCTYIQESDLNKDTDSYYLRLAFMKKFVKRL